MNIAVYCGSASGNRPSFTEGAKALGSWIAQNGHTLVYGGSRTGLMGATADAVLAGGGKVIGVIPDVKLIQERRHPGLTECIETKDMAERKQKMIELADAYVALPGGPGTLDEISEVICLARLGIENKACVLFDTESRIFGKRRLQAGSGIRRSGRNWTLYRTIEQRAKRDTAA